MSAHPENQAAATAEDLRLPVQTAAPCGGQAPAPIPGPARACGGTFQKALPRPAPWPSPWAAPAPPIPGATRGRDTVPVPRHPAQTRRGSGPAHCAAGKWGQAVTRAPPAASRDRRPRRGTPPHQRSLRVRWGASHSRLPPGRSPACSRPGWHGSGNLITADSFLLTLTHTPRSACDGPLLACCARELRVAVSTSYPQGQAHVSGSAATLPATLDASAWVTPVTAEVTLPGWPPDNTRSPSLPRAPSCALTAPLQSPRSPRTAWRAAGVAPGAARWHPPLCAGSRAAG